jgi:hypothetical protein
MKFNVSIHAIVECASPEEAAMQADRIKGLLKNPMVGMMLKSSGVKMVGSPTVGKPEEKK